jgi:DNA-3-methyladenine glycosylase II
LQRLLHLVSEEHLLPALAQFPHPPEAARAGLAHLAASDPMLAGIEAAAGILPWRRRPRGFVGLLQAITAQQISAQAAASIWRRLSALPGALEPESLLLLDENALRAAGFSRPKVAHARTLAAHFADGRLSAAALDAMDDDAAMAALTAVPGLGPWTASVYLLFAHERADVFPAGDVALAGAYRLLRQLPERPSPGALAAAAEPWRPYRGLAARLLWHHWRHATGRPAQDELPATVG